MEIRVVVGKLVCIEILCVGNILLQSLSSEYRRLQPEKGHVTKTDTGSKSKMATVTQLL